MAVQNNYLPLAVKPPNLVNWVGCFDSFASAELVDHHIDEACVVVEDHCNAVGDLCLKANLACEDSFAASNQVVAHMTCLGFNIAVVMVVEMVKANHS